MHNVAVGAEPGNLRLLLPNGGCHTAGSSTARTNEVGIPITTINTIMSEYEGTNLVLLKMDIEGSVLNALMGAKETIDRHKPPVLIELNEQA